MLLIGPSTSNKLQLVTSAAADVEVSVSGIVTDTSAPPVVQGSEFISDPLASIVTATTTDIVTGASSRVKRVGHLSIRNSHASTATDLTVRHVDGTDTVDIIKVSLLAGETLLFNGTTWIHYDSQGGQYTYAAPPAANLGITGTLAESIPRELCPEVNTTAPASGTLAMQAIYLKAGTLVSNITLASATTAANAPTNYFFALYDSNRNLLAQSANQTSSAWAANTVKTLAMSTPYRVPVSGLYYIGYFMTATTVPTLKGGTARTGGQLAGTAPIIYGSSSTGLTTALPNPAAAITSGTASIYAAVS